MDKITARRRKAARQAPQADAMAQSSAAPLAAEQDDLDESPTGTALEVADEAIEMSAEDQADADAIAEEQRQQRLDQFGAALAKKRKVSVEARRASGIEDIWREDEEFYEGIDDANRNEVGARVTKPRDLSGTGAANITEVKAATGSTVFYNITRPYVDFSAARAADMLLPTDDLNWDLRETPMPDIISEMTSEKPLNLPPNAPADAPKTYGEAATCMVMQSKDQVEKAKRRIQDWLEEGQYGAEQRKLLRDASKVGVAILKGPFPVKRMARAINRGDDGSISMHVQNKTPPQSKCISYWNFFPDPACGEDIHSGGYVWERDTITARKLRDLMGTMDADGNPMYLEATIKQCLREGPQKKFEDTPDYNPNDNEVFEIWYYNGVACAEDLQAAGLDPDMDEVLPVLVTMVNDRVIKAARTTLDTGEFPYDAMVWQEREGHWAGIGVARQVRTPQRMLNGAIRNMLDNAGLAAGPQIVIKDGVIKPLGANQPYKITPRAMWKMSEDSAIDDVRKAFASIEIPMVIEELKVLMDIALKAAEDSTGMPMLMQGQQGQASTTVGGMQILTNNSNTPLRSIAKQFDDRITVPHLLRYYEWLLLYGPDDGEKGEYVVAARGSSALFERDAQNQAIMGMAQLIGNPAFRIDPEKWIKEAMKAQRLDPNKFQYSDAEWTQVQQQMAQNQPQDPALQVAQINAKARLDAAQIVAQVQQQRIKSDGDRDTQFAQAETVRDQNDHEAKMGELAMQRELALLEYANQQKLSLDTVKSQLAQTAMKVQAQKELSAMSAGLDMHKHTNPSPQVLTPPTEPAGRAPNGEAFQA